MSAKRFEFLKDYAMPFGTIKSGSVYVQCKNKDVLRKEGKATDGNTVRLSQVLKDGYVKEIQASVDWSALRRDIESAAAKHGMRINGNIAEFRDGSCSLMLVKDVSGSGYGGNAESIRYVIDPSKFTISFE
jgi:hypothetical protein